MESKNLKLFITYSRANTAIADQLVAALEDADFDVRIDRRDLPYGEEWQQELGNFIREADTVIWLVSPDSVKSSWCLWELGEVQRTGKRLIPVHIETVPPEALPEALGRIHLLPAVGTYDPDQHFADLVETLNTDRAWLKEHTRLAERARSWRKGDKSRDQLLRGGALNAAEVWRDRQPATAPRATQEVLDLILASRQAHGRRQRLTVAGSLAGLVLAVGLSIVAMTQRNAAIAARDLADAARVRAQELEQLANSARERAETQQKRAEAALSAAIKSANGLVFRLAQQFRVADQIRQVHPAK